MSAIEELRRRGMELLREVALRYAGQHGLRPDKVEWVEQGGGEWWLKVSTGQHSVRVVFSLDEIEEFAGGGPETAITKTKIRNAFAGLAM